MGRFVISDLPRGQQGGLCFLDSNLDGFAVLQGQSEFIGEAFENSFVLNLYDYSATGAPTLATSTDISAHMNGGSVNSIFGVDVSLDLGGNTWISYIVNGAVPSARLLVIDAQGQVLVPETTIDATAGQAFLLESDASGFGVGSLSLFTNAFGEDAGPFLTDLSGTPRQTIDLGSPVFSEPLALDDGALYRVATGTQAVVQLLAGDGPPQGDFVIVDDETDRFESLYAVGNRILDIDVVAVAGGSEVQFTLMERGQSIPTRTGTIAGGLVDPSAVLTTVHEIDGTGFAVMSSFMTPGGDPGLILDVFDLDGQRLRTFDLTGIASSFLILDFVGLNMRDEIGLMVTGLNANFDRTLGFQYGFDAALNLRGTATHDLLIGRDRGDVLLGFGGSDRLRGELGKDTLEGGSGNDTLSGGGGIDQIDTGSGNDLAEGGAGRDTLITTGGNDFLSGEGGADSFVFHPSASGTVTILDFQSGQDRLVLDIIDGIAQFEDLGFFADPDGLAFQYGAITVLLVGVEQLTGADVTFV